MPIEYSSREEEDFVKAHLHLVQVSPQEYVAHRWKAIRDFFKGLPLAIKILIVLAVLILPFLFLHMGMSVLTGPVRMRRLCIGAGFVVAVLLFSVWGTSGFQTPLLTLLNGALTGSEGEDD
jgi:hypothetical protein